MTSFATVHLAVLKMASENQPENAEKCRKLYDLTCSDRSWVPHACQVLDTGQQSKTVVLIEAGASTRGFTVWKMEFGVP